MNSPVLLLIFNRPDTTARVFDAIRAAQPSRLYLAADGPRADRPGEQERTAATRALTEDVTWPCEVTRLYRDSNLGCRRAVSEAIDWFFEHEPEGIILEDDCLPDQTFFPFCDQLIERYRDEPRVMNVSGHYRLPTEPPNSYTFSRYPGIWGWATWRDAWARYDRNMVAWPDLRNTPWLASKSDDPNFQHAWRARFDATYRREIDSWGYAWVFSLFLHDGLAAVAGRNLIVNIGFGDDATHTVKGLPQRELRPLEFPLRHPPDVARNEALDRWIDKNVHVPPRRRPRIRRCLRPIRRWLQDILLRR